MNQIDAVFARVIAEAEAVRPYGGVYEPHDDNTDDRITFGMWRRAIEAAAAAAEQEREALRAENAKLREYARHQPWCKASVYPGGDMMAVCTCGYLALRADAQLRESLRALPRYVLADPSDGGLDDDWVRASDLLSALSVSPQEEQ